MYTIKADLQKNRLYVVLKGFFGNQEMKECTDKAIEESRKLKPGYDVITDISEFKPVGSETVKEIERGQAHFKSSGIGRGVRVVGKTVLTGMQFNRLGHGVGYAPKIVETMAEAEAFLESKEGETV